MFDFDAGKVLLFGIVALVVVGPRDLPRVLRVLGQINARMRRMIAQFRSDLMAAVDGVEGDPKAAAKLARLDISRDPATAMRGRFAPRSELAPAAPSRAAVEPIYASPEMKRYLGDPSDLEPAALETGDSGRGGPESRA